MTRVAGFRQVRVPCCGKVYVRPNYRSINFMADENWTDGWREASLMPNDTGLRRCQCGQFLLMRETESLGVTEHTEGLTLLSLPQACELAQCIASNQPLLLR